MRGERHEREQLAGAKVCLGSAYLLVVPHRRLASPPAPALISLELCHRSKDKQSLHVMTLACLDTREREWARPRTQTQASQPYPRTKNPMRRSPCSHGTGADVACASRYAHGSVTKWRAKKAQCSPGRQGSHSLRESRQSVRVRRLLGGRLLGGRSFILKRFRCVLCRSAMQCVSAPERERARTCYGAENTVVRER